jgi:DNA-binding IclR family transcriptional regulator
MLAALPNAQLRALYPSRSALVQREGRGPSTLTELRRLVTATRAAGFAVEDGSVTQGFASVACAVTDHRGWPTAAVALTYAAADVGPAERDDLVVHARRAAALIARGLAPTGRQSP